MIVEYTVMTHVLGPCSFFQVFKPIVFWKLVVVLIVVIE